MDAFLGDAGLDSITLDTAMWRLALVHAKDGDTEAVGKVLDNVVTTTVTKAGKPTCHRAIVPGDSAIARLGSIPGTARVDGCYSLQNSLLHAVLATTERRVFEKAARVVVTDTAAPTPETVPPIHPASGHRADDRRAPCGAETRRTPMTSTTRTSAPPIGECRRARRPRPTTGRRG
ncbi:hypothetical protein ACIP88_01290 [Streptomyces uncialis]|uniref:hypothetical protein n=1 Tax=Streptomyces uncialis TaxID=1048205 RepID=UPI0038137D9A